MICLNAQLLRFSCFQHLYNCTVQTEEQRVLDDGSDKTPTSSTSPLVRVLLEKPKANPQEIMLEVNNIIPSRTFSRFLTKRERVCIPNNKREGSPLIRGLLKKTEFMLQVDNIILLCKFVIPNIEREGLYSQHRERDLH